MKHLFYALLIIGLGLGSCSKDDDDSDTRRTPVCESGEQLTYASLKPLIDSKCATSGCHGAGSSRGDFTTYAGMLPDIDAGRINQRVLVSQDMPRNSTLTQTELNRFQCWADNDFAE